MKTGSGLSQDAVQIAIAAASRILGAEIAQNHDFIRVSGGCSADSPRGDMLNAVQVVRRKT